MASGPRSPRPEPRVHSHDRCPRLADSAPHRRAVASARDRCLDLGAAGPRTLAATRAAAGPSAPALAGLGRRWRGTVRRGHQPPHSGSPLDPWSQRPARHRAHPGGDRGDRTDPPTSLVDRARGVERRRRIADWAVAGTAPAAPGAAAAARDAAGRQPGAHREDVVSGGVDQSHGAHRDPGAQASGGRGGGLSAHAAGSRAPDPAPSPRLLRRRRAAGAGDGRRRRAAGAFRGAGARLPWRADCAGNRPRWPGGPLHSARVGSGTALPSAAAHARQPARCACPTRHCAACLPGCPPATSIHWR
jgi:hypothetical protein